MRSNDASATLMRPSNEPFDTVDPNSRVVRPQRCDVVHTLFDIRADGTAATDIEHIVALAEAYDSGLPESRFRAFAADLDNLTIAAPDVNRRQKRDRNAGDWKPPEHRGWFAARVVAIKREYALSVNRAERDALADMLAGDPSRSVTCGGAGPDDGSVANDGGKETEDDDSLASPLSGAAEQRGERRLAQSPLPSVG